MLSAREPSHQRAVLALLSGERHDREERRAYTAEAEGQLFERNEILFDGVVD